MLGLRGPPVVSPLLMSSPADLDGALARGWLSPALPGLFLSVYVGRVSRLIRHGWVGPMPANETDLCHAFINAVDAEWTAYPETGGFDILLVRRDGFQIGVQAKLRLTAKVLQQAIEGRYETTSAGPDCRSVLVPKSKFGATAGALRDLSPLLGITVIKMDMPGSVGRLRFQPQLPELPRQGDRYPNQEWHELCPERRIALPKYVPDVEPGARSPIQLTPWKICAIKLSILLDRRGHVTRTDFKRLAIDPRRWISSEWVVAVDGRFTRGPNMPDLRSQHPRNYTEIDADFHVWNMDRPQDGGGMLL